MSATIRERLIVALLARGENFEPARTTSRYIAMSRSDTTINAYIYIGKAGACRVGATASDSYSFDKLRDTLLSEADALPPAQFKDLKKKVPKL